MYNSNKPTPEELPTTAQLIKSTLIALIAAVIILITIVLPAEYGIDPTKIGRALGLAQMGEIKQQLAREAEEDHSDADALLAPAPRHAAMLEAIGALLVGQAHAQTVAAPEWTDEAIFTLAPGEGYEIKLAMKKDAVAEYAWTAQGGRMNYDLHAHAGGQDARYKRGRGAAEDSGAFTAAFDGNHGWFFRNRDSQPVTITLKVRGDYAEIKREE